MADWVGLELRDWGFRLQDITMNVSLWQGERDTWVSPAAAKYMASKLTNHTLHFVPDFGHLAVLIHHAEDVLRELLSASDAQRMTVSGRGPLFFCGRGAAAAG